MTTPLERIQLSWPSDVTNCIEELSHTAEMIWLDSAANANYATDRARMSFVAVAPIATIAQFEPDRAELRVAGVVRERDSSALRLWQRVHRRLPACAASEPGWFGYIGFEMAAHLERLPGLQRPASAANRMRMSLFDAVIVLDHDRRAAELVVIPDLAREFDIDLTDFAKLRSDWDAAARTINDEDRAIRHRRSTMTVETPQHEHEARVRRAIEYIGAGDIYQVNLAHRLVLSDIGTPLDTYRRLRHSNPASYGAFLQWPGGAIASVSPELFLQIRGRDVLTRPIKGTRPRTGDARVDAANQRELLASEKDAAELAMIVDLHRNDLGRVCEFGSVRVAHPRRLEAHPSVFHTVADVTGRLTDGRDALDLLMACFPAGSVTGVPKIRAMEIIGELEPVARGAYTGAIGRLGLNGDASFSVAIRTLQMADNLAYLHVGGGIVADSEPAAEYDETLAKAAGILRGLGIGQSVHANAATD